MRSYNAVEYGEKQLKELRKQSKQLRKLRKKKHMICASAIKAEPQNEEGWNFNYGH